MASGLIGTVPPPADPTKTLTGGVMTAPNTTPANVASVAAPVKAQPRQITEPETVAGQLNSLLSKDSDYIQSARNRGMEEAHSRGLINSSLAAGTAERAAIDASLPIAQQDATIAANAGQSAQNANQDINLTGFKSTLDSAQAHETAGYNKDINTQNIAANTALQTQKDLATSALSSQQAGESATLQAQKDAANLGLIKQQAADTAALQTQKDNATLALNTYLNTNMSAEKKASLTSTEYNNLSSIISPIFQTMAAAINSVQIQPDSVMDSTSKEKAYADIKDQAIASADTLSSLYGLNVTWK